MKNNTYFEELNQTARAFEEKHEAHKALKKQIIDEKGWDSEELKAWYKEEEENFQYRSTCCFCSFTALLILTYNLHPHCQTHPKCPLDRLLPASRFL